MIDFFLGSLFCLFVFVLPVIYDYWITRIRSRAWYRGKKDTRCRKVKK